MKTEQLKELNWDTQLPTTLAGAVDALEDDIQAHAFDYLGKDFLKMYFEFMRI